MQQPNAKGPDVIPSEIPEEDRAFMDHIDDTVGNPGFYRDQNGLQRWRITAGEGEVLASADRGFPTREDAQADYDEKVAANTLPALKVFQPKNGASGVQRDEEGDPIEGAPPLLNADGTEREEELYGSAGTTRDANEEAQQNAKPDLGVASGARKASSSTRKASSKK